MTTTTCRQLCWAQYTHMALVTGDACHCDNVTSSHTSYDVTDRVPMTWCNTSCTGDSMQWCGGPGLYSVYHLYNDSMVDLGQRVVDPAVGMAKSCEELYINNVIVSGFYKTTLGDVYCNMTSRYQSFIVLLIGDIIDMLCVYTNAE